MSIQRTQEYYDKHYLETEEYIKPYEQSEYFQLWKKVIELIPPNTKITEIGSGPGQFAKMLYDQGFRKYHGYDFSVKACEMAKENVPSFQFTAWDVLKCDFDATDDHNFFIALEVMEHTRDFKLIDNLGLGKTIIFSVPDFNDPAHVRYFHSINEVVSRYKDVILFEYVQKIGSWYLCKGTTI